MPGDDSWPRLSRNVKLGVRIAAIRSAGRYVKDHPERKAELDNMGFEWRLRDTKKGETSKAANTDDLFESVYQALSIYQRRHGDVEVPPDYEVSADNPDYPAELLQVSNHIPMSECEIHMFQKRLTSMECDFLAGVVTESSFLV